MKFLPLAAVCSAALLLAACGSDDANKVADNAANLTEKATAAVAEAAEKTTEVAKEAVETTTEAAAETAEKATDAVTETVDAAKEAVAEKVEEVKEAAAEKVEAVKEAVEEKVDAAKEAATDAVTGAVAGIAGGSAAASVADTAGAAVDAKGKQLYATCAGCHGAKGDMKALGVSKLLSEMDATEIGVALAGYKAGTYGGAMKDLMKGQVNNLSETDIAALSAYIPTLK